MSQGLSTSLWFIPCAGGPLVGGAVKGINRHWIFWLNVPVGLVLTALSLRRPLESFGPATRLDPLAALLVSAGATSAI